MVRYTTTAGCNLLLGLQSLSSSDWVKTHRSCTANGSSRLDSAESSLVYTANLRAVQSCRQAARPALLAAEHEASSRTDYSGCLCFLCKSIHKSLYPLILIQSDTAKKILPPHQLRPYLQSKSRGALANSRQSTKTSQEPAVL